MTDDAEVENTPVTICSVEVLNSREYAVRQSLLKNTRGIRRTELFILNKRTGRPLTRSTINTYDDILQASEIVDYRKDAVTKESLWDKRKPFTLHQAWCLRKVSEFMETPSYYRNTEGKKRKYKKTCPLRCPTYEELKEHLSAHPERYSFQTFIEEYFKWPPHTTT
jgi:hypothetical protein